MSSCRKTDIQNELHKITNLSEFAKINTVVNIPSCFNTGFFKNREIKKKVDPPVGFKPAIPGV